MHSRLYLERLPGPGLPLLPFFPASNYCLAASIAGGGRAGHAAGGSQGTAKPQTLPMDWQPPLLTPLPPPPSRHVPGGTTTT